MQRVRFQWKGLGFEVLLVVMEHLLSGFGMGVPGLPSDQVSRPQISNHRNSLNPELYTQETVDPRRALRIPKVDGDP